MLQQIASWDSPRSFPGYARILDPAGEFLNAGGAAEISRRWSEAQPPANFRRLFQGLNPCNPNSPAESSLRASYDNGLLRSRDPHHSQHARMRAYPGRVNPL